MTWHPHHKIERFCVVGVNFRKADIAIRSRFALNEEAAESLRNKAVSLGITGLVLLNTCNRVEMYGFTEGEEILIDLMVEFSAGASTELFHSYGFSLRGLDAFRHVFRVGAGLESQIPGDFEIAGQIKQSLKQSANSQLLGPLVNRLFSLVLQASKKVKNETGLSKGTVSVSFAAVHWLNREVPKDDLKILQVGAGAFGQKVLKNLQTYCTGATISLTNRNPEKSLELCREHGFKFVPFDGLATVINDFDVIVCCTNAPAPFIEPSMLNNGQARWIIDLSVPANVAVGVNEIPMTRVANIDEISELVSKTLEYRMSEVPRALDIIEHHLAIYLEWLNDCPKAFAVARFKKNLQLLRENPFYKKPMVSAPNFTGNYHSMWNQGVNEKAGLLMQNVKQYRNKGCQVILAYHNFLQVQMQSSVHA